MKIIFSIFLLITISSAVPLLDRPTRDVWTPIEILLYASKTVVNRDSWFCGSTDLQMAASHGVIATSCNEKMPEINHCCAVHDSCYDNYYGFQKHCDWEFCNCLERAMTRTPRLPSTCTKIPTHAACHLVQWFGDSSQKSQKPKQDPIGFHPALNQTVIQEYNKLYKECAGFRKPITSCAYNHMVCTLEMLPQERYNQEYTDCRDQLVNCINESATFLEMRKSTVCAAQLDIALEAIKDDARLSGMSADYFYVNTNTTAQDIQ
ncbi:Protein CBG19861 [Caenorhabditis briggsae]|uniref:Uncharacterized protein n=2 Tax=Caenorhabditis briggsae TaxID=6238 RepID=A0AAE9AG89_CAEBR|nr:Protein CBG19861 [Caenorhabditis briggsae]ULT94478.1 hypothetical protein L3Y34_003746 [Caenorhabditis briggsae]UMM27730.1 hypothetical protein L5515_010896 [Caenorhabditis briggsae]CAP37037.1 Protein CBG19861 [Caenorhabditis briggsae]